MITHILHIARCFFLILAFLKAIEQESIWRHFDINYNCGYWYSEVHVHIHVKDGNPDNVHIRTGKSWKKATGPGKFWKSVKVSIRPKCIFRFSLSL